ncbi:MAG: hypothetical protein CVT79_04970 [Alphaproteobacteria bacterium HGW-Alphaproteobacteria-18]|nr:MAG: hypothetical protein CVT79_04970 [Alphaproteobacteria bacterium HGW-Alphaproteobacteria-18]
MEVSVEAQLQARGIVVIGASIAGLSAALAFNRRGIPVTILERDVLVDVKDQIAPNGIIQRRGVPHSMQPHFFLSGLRNALSHWYPGLIEQMVDAGVKEIPVKQCLPRTRNSDAIPKPGDEDLTVLASRRAVLEQAMRKYAERQQGITLRTSVKVLRLLSDGKQAPFQVNGLEYEEGGQTHTLSTDVIVDASGRMTRFLDSIIEEGAHVDDFHYKSNSAYFTRHYRLRTGQDFPSFVGMPGVLFDDLVATTFAADDANFVMSIVVNQDDSLLYDRALSKPAVFEDILRRIPKAARWIEPERAEPTSPVVSWANMDFFWRKLAPDGRVQVLGYFPVGDSVIRSNPKFGRGCTWSVLGSDMLADILARGGSPEELVINYQNALEERFRSEWAMMLTVDKEDQARFETRVGLAPNTIRSRAASAVAHWTSNIAPTVDPTFYRELVKAYYGITSPAAWATKPSNWLRVLRANVVPGASLRLARKYSERPSRDEIASIIASHCPPEKSPAPIHA